MELGCSKDQATRRFLQNEKTLTRKGSWDAFSDGIIKYFTMDHAETVPPLDLLKPECESYYLPMHGVVKETSTTTKLRVVFDASSKSSTGHSLNDRLLPGANLYPLLTEVVMKFRLHFIGLSADISKMFREIGLAQKDRLSSIRLATEGQPATSRSKDTRLTFGVTSSPFLATQVLHQLAKDYQTRYPKASNLIVSGFYVDDCLTGAATEDEAKEIREELNSLLAEGCMTLRKWRSNNSNVLDSIPAELREKEKVQQLPAIMDHHRTLGLHWDTAADAMHVATSSTGSEDPPTKRKIASDVAKAFDLLGWYTPTILIIKSLMQKLWQDQLSWDDPAPEDVCKVWRQWRAELPLVNQHLIPSHYFDSGKNILTLQLHGFCDVSQAAYGGAVYLRAVYSDTTTSSTLVTSKTKVAPLKPTTIPRLELCAAHLLGKLLSHTAEVLGITLSDIYAWTDSAITLGWLNLPPHHLKVFVANRVADTVSKVPADHWRHVPTQDNPADIASRGMLPGELLQSTSWWHGPEWLLLAPDCWPSRTFTKQSLDLPDIKNTPVLLTVEGLDIFNHYSSHHHLVRVVTWMYRFSSKCRAKSKEKKQLSATLTTVETSHAETRLFLIHQQKMFSQELKALTKGKELPKCSPLTPLRPFINEAGLLWVGGRLRRSELPDARKHPVILHRAHNLSKLLVRELHRKHQHAGTTTLMGILCRNYYMV